MDLSKHHNNPEDCKKEEVEGEEHHNEITVVKGQQELHESIFSVNIFKK